MRRVAKPVHIGELSFKTKSAAKDYIRAVRARYPCNGVKIGGSDELFLHDLLALHPEARDKVGVGVSHFTMETGSAFGTSRHLTVHRTDGSSTDFSFHACIDGRNERSDRLKALRYVISEQILAFRNEVFAPGIPVICPLDGSVLSPTTCHIDHAYPTTFLVLVEGWLTEGRIRIEEIGIEPSRDNLIMPGMTDPAQAASWAGYHQARAVLRAVSPRANLIAPKIRARATSPTLRI
jgi:hypothetical protein